MDRDGDRGPVIRGGRRGGQDGRPAQAGRLGRGEGAGPAAVDQPGRGRGRLGELAGRQVRRGRARGRARPAVSRSSRSGSPATTRRASARKQPARPGVRRRIAGDRQVRPVAAGSDSTSGVRIEPGPDLDEDPRPVAVHRLDHVGEPHRAGEVLAQPRGDRRRVGRVGRGVEVRVDRPVGRPAEQLARPAGPAARARRRPAACGRREETGSSRRRGPRAAASSTTRSTAAAGPATTVCRGPFQLAACTSGHLADEPLDLRPDRPGWPPSRRAAPRPASHHEPAPRRRQLGQRRRRRARPRRAAPPARRSCGRRPCRARSPEPRSSRSMPTHAAPTAGWATSVRISGRRASARAGVVEGRRREDERARRGPAAGPQRRDRTPRTPPRTSGNATASSPSMPGACAPWPGKRNATGCAGPRRLGREDDAARIVAARSAPRRSPSAASRSFSRRSSCESATIASVGAGPRRPAPAPLAPRSACATGRGAPAARRPRAPRPAGRSSRSGRPARRPRQTSSSAGQSGKRRRGRAGSCCGRMPRGRRGSSSRRTRRR